MTDYGPKITKLTGNEIRVAADDRARAFWLIQKYSSLAYTRRMSVLFFNFVGGYEDFAKTKTAGVRFYRDSLTEFYADVATGPWGSHSRRDHRCPGPGGQGCSSSSLSL
jgi:hypothetical protein